MKTTFALVLTIATAITAWAQKAPPTTPAARNWLQGLEARRQKFERITAQLKKAAADQGANARVPRSLFCPMALEAALGAALADAHFANGKNEDFHLTFNAPGKQQFLDVSYTYNQRGALLLTGIHKLPDGWTVGMQPGEPSVGKFIVVTDEATGCVYEFDAGDPFASQAMVALEN